MGSRSLRPAVHSASQEVAQSEDAVNRHRGVGIVNKSRRFRKGLSWANLLWLALLAGCGGLVRTHAWERGTLARTDMTLDSEGVDLDLDDHIYFSREATAGGRTFGGGGCGCN